MIKGIFKAGCLLMATGVAAIGLTVYGFFGGFSKVRPGQEDLSVGERIFDNAIDATGDVINSAGEVIDRNIKDRTSKGNPLYDLFKKQGLRLTFEEQQMPLRKVCDVNSADANDDPKCSGYFNFGVDGKTLYKDAPEYNNIIGMPE